MFRKLTLSLAAILAVVGLSRRADAQTFPAEDKWSPLPCGAGSMIDGYRDQSGAISERDIVGDTLDPAGYRATDATFAYLRMRLDADAAPGKNPRPFAWGFEIDLDGNRSTYEILIILRGSDKNVVVYRNTATTLPDDPNDPADEPPVATFPFATHGRSTTAPRSRYGSDDDFFLDVAIPWTTLESLGLTRTTPATVWAATSSVNSSLNGDLACHDGTTGAPKLSTVAPPPTTLDPAVDSDGDGWSDAIEVTNKTDPKNPASHPAGTPPPLGGGPIDPVLEGGGGCKCSLARPATNDVGLVALVVALAVATRRRHRRR
jgi:hypothetical protein